MRREHASIRTDGVDALNLEAEYRRMIGQDARSVRSGMDQLKARPPQRSIGDMTIQMEKENEFRRFKDTFGLDDRDIDSQPSTFPPYIRLQARVRNAGNMKIFNFPFPVCDTKPETLFSPEEVRVARELATHYSGTVTVSKDMKRRITALAVVTERDTIRVATISDEGDVKKIGANPALDSPGPA